jgi:ABC-type uncharacterized transport system permease subunit
MILSSTFLSAATSSLTSMLGVVSVVSISAYVVAAVLSERFSTLLRLTLVLGWLAHAVAIAADITGFGHAEFAARFGFAPALSMTLWFVLAVYLIESRFVPLPGVRRVLTLLGVFVVVVAWSFPGELRPQVSVRWMPLHWALGLASYGLFGAAVLHAVMLNRAERLMRAGTITAPIEHAPKSMPLLQLERMTFRFVGAGFVVLTAALALGVWFADPWRWDHKTVFSVLGWLVFASLLAGRRAFGWRGPVATRWLYAGVVLLLLAYVGSRFVLEVLLHRVI